jgi:hypothetical protein
MTAAREQEMTKLIKRVERLADELRLSSLNLRVANAKLRCRDSAFRAVNRDVNELLDSAAAAQAATATVLERSKVEQVGERDKYAKPAELDVYLHRIKELAERIVQTVVAIKQGRRVDHNI